MSPSTETRENRGFAYEYKFMLSRALAGEIRDWAREKLSPDPNAKGDASDTYLITSLYLDTEKFDVFNRRASFGRSKYRIRRYGPATSVFLERKLKTHGLVSKRRSIVGIPEIARLEGTGPINGWVGGWYLKRLLLRQLRPVCQIAYHRTARVLATKLGPIRLTIDEDVRAVPLKSLAFDDQTAGVPLLPDRAILELKYRISMPLLFKQLVAKFSLNPGPISKYQLAVAALGLAPRDVVDRGSRMKLDRQICLNS
jgi:hypothetical protein